MSTNRKDGVDLPRRGGRCNNACTGQCKCKSKSKSHGCMAYAPVWAGLAVAAGLAWYSFGVLLPERRAAEAETRVALGAIVDQLDLLLEADNERAAAGNVLMQALYPVYTDTEYSITGVGDDGLMVDRKVRAVKVLDASGAWLDLHPCDGGSFVVTARRRDNREGK